MCTKVAVVLDISSFNWCQSGLNKQSYYSWFLYVYEATRNNENSNVHIVCFYVI